LFSYPKNGSNAGEVGNFFQETGIGARYSSSVFTLYASLMLDSPETTGDKMDATGRFTLKVPVLGLFDIGVAGHFGNLFSTAESWLEEQISGSVAGLGWYVQGHEDLGDSLTTRIWAGVDYGIPLSAKAKATFGLDGGGTLADSFGTIWYQPWAKVAYDFNDKVSTSAKLNVKGYVDPSDITPTLWWIMNYSF